MEHPREAYLPASILRNATHMAHSSASSCVGETKKEPSVLDGTAAAIGQDACAAEGKQRLLYSDGGVDSNDAPSLLGSSLTPFSCTEGSGFKKLSLEVSATETSQISCDLHEAFILFEQQKCAQTWLKVDTSEKALEEEVQSLRSTLRMSKQREESNFRAIKEVCMQLHLVYRILDSQRSDLSCAEMESN
jgi:hypothetical protein